jgi:hypothetical protein
MRKWIVGIVASLALLTGAAEAQTSDRMLKLKQDTLAINVALVVGGHDDMLSTALLEVVETTGSTDVALAIIAPADGSSRIELGDVDDPDESSIAVNHTTPGMIFNLPGGEAFRVRSGLHVGIGESSNDTYTLEVDGTTGYAFKAETEGGASWNALFHNKGTNHNLYVNQEAVLAAGDRAIYMYTNDAQTNSGPVYWHVDNPSTTQDVFTITNDGSGGQILLSQAGVLAVGEPVFHIYSNADHDNATQMILVHNDNNSSTWGNDPMVEFRDDGHGDFGAGYSTLEVTGRAFRHRAGLGSGVGFLTVYFQTAGSTAGDSILIGGRTADGSIAEMYLKGEGSCRWAQYQYSHQMFSGEFYVSTERNASTYNQSYFTSEVYGNDYAGWTPPTLVNNSTGNAYIKFHNFSYVTNKLMLACIGNWLDTSAITDQ